MANVLKFTMGMVLGTVLMVVCISPAVAQEECPMTLDTLPMCVTHHWESGDISNHGIYNSLLAKANAAIEAQDHGKTECAINILNSFIKEVKAQSSKTITPEAADHMIMHAQTVIKDLQSSSHKRQSKNFNCPVHKKPLKK